MAQRRVTIAMAAPRDFKVSGTDATYMQMRLYEESEQPVLSTNRFLLVVEGDGEDEDLNDRLRECMASGSRMSRLASSDLINSTTKYANLSDAEIMRIAYTLCDACERRDDAAVLNAVLQLVDPQVLLNGHSKQGSVAANALVSKGSRGQTRGVGRLVTRAAATLIVSATTAYALLLGDDYNLQQPGPNARRNRRLCELAILITGGAISGMLRRAEPMRKKTAESEPAASLLAADQPWFRRATHVLDLMVTVCLMLVELKRFQEAGYSGSGEDTMLLKDFLGVMLERDMVPERDYLRNFMSYMLYILMDNLLRVVRALKTMMMMIAFQSMPPPLTALVHSSCPVMMVAAVCIRQSTRAGGWHHRSHCR